MAIKIDSAIQVQILDVTSFYFRAKGMNSSLLSPARGKQ